ncbi:hypothetical protein HMPREF0525_00763 [Lactobacillus jensenii 27-2-CHN]|nr:hypothetical protein HMPREF0525_00763 [Lactobacillus jensenii 27-2-CHN]EEX24699.1 hypothetical protein HMPREF0974_00504 [Lactobacillus jensenii 115-3-CHN]EFH29818.1 hypothetical protein HMPREF0526_11421 [Lactobacillus jensenii JV-V16]OEH66488.1 hypothetical protein BFX48_00865 [Lactobacillus jensenii]
MRITYCKTLLTFKHNLRAVLNGARFSYSNGCLEGFNSKIKQIERTAYGYSNYIYLLTRIRLEKTGLKKKNQAIYILLDSLNHSISTVFDKEPFFHTLISIKMYSVVYRF